MRQRTEAVEPFETVPNEDFLGRLKSGMSRCFEVGAVDFAIDGSHCSVLAIGPEPGGKPLPGTSLEVRRSGLMRITLEELPCSSLDRYSSGCTS